MHHVFVYVYNRSPLIAFDRRIMNITYVRKRHYRKMHKAT